MSDSLGGRPPYEPTDKDRRTVELMTAAGIPQENIARCLSICVNTMVKYYREEMDTAADKATAQVAGTLFKRAVDLNHPQGAICAMFWLKTRARWREPQEHQLTGKDGKELTVYTGVVRDQPDEAP